MIFQFKTTYALYLLENNGDAISSNEGNNNRGNTGEL